MDTEPQAEPVVYLSRDAILARAREPHRTERIDVPEWGGTLWVRELSALEYEHYEELAREQPGMIRAGLVAAAAVDRNGSQLFGPRDIDYGRLAALPVSGLRRVFLAALKLNQATEAAIDDEKKDSNATPAGDD